MLKKNLWGLRGQKLMVIFQIWSNNLLPEAEQFPLSQAGGQKRHLSLSSMDEGGVEVKIPTPLRKLCPVQGTLPTGHRQMPRCPLK